MLHAGTKCTLQSSVQMTPVSQSSTTVSYTCLWYSFANNRQVPLQIAGAVAAEGLSLKEVAAVANDTAKQCRSVGVATHICTLPGAAPSDRSVVQPPMQPRVFETCAAKRTFVRTVGRWQAC